jgi:tetratricopeptide (TPR) repeat protein
LYFPGASAKEPSLTAIELYDGSAGAAYVQLQNVLINGKIEVRDCTPSGTSPIDKSAYNKFNKVMLSAGGVLERGADGVLRYSTAGGQPICVVPANVKFEHSASLSPAAMAENIPLTGSPIPPSSDGATGVPPLKNGVKLVFVAAPDVELAEFLLAQRGANVAGWRNYLAKYPASPHTDEAKDTLTSLYVEAGEKALGNYQKSVGTGAQSYSDLKEAKAQADLAHALRPDFKGSVQLAEEIRGRLQALTDKGRTELEAYSAALAAHSPGYVHLETARALAEGIAGVDSQFPPGIKLLNDVSQARNTFESALQSAASASAQKQMDDALKFVLPYLAFAQENPRVAQVIDATYNYHYDLGKLAEQGQDWETAVKEYEKASSTKDMAEARNSLKDAKQKLANAQDQAAAKAALDKSHDYEAQKDLIDAYEVLSNLSATQRAFVSDDIDRLIPGYVQAASDKAKNITKTYPEIKGIEDERQVEQAYALLQSAYKLSDDSAAKASYQTRIEILGEELSEWFLNRAKHYLDKPAGSFTEVGWAYLKEAESYKASNLEQVRDQRTAAGPAQAMHSKLSIRIHFVDQTSLREGTGFMHQMEDAIITELQKPAYQATPVRYGETTNGIEPDFQLEGNVLEHVLTESSSSVSMDSHYRSGTHQETNEAWTKANRAYEDARDQLQSDQAELDAASKINNKKKMAEFGNKVSDDRKLVSDAGTKRDSIQQNVIKDDIRPYQYTVKTTNIKNSIKLQFSIGRTQSGQMGVAMVVGREDPKQYVQVEDVKGEDTDGIKLNETKPNTQEMQTALEISVRDDLIASVGKKVRELPQAIYDEAKLRAQEENLDDAGEAYMRYLSVTPADETPERTHAEQFLREQFNFLTFPNVAP